jgi:hypothetical protein
MKSKPNGIRIQNSKTSRTLIPLNPSHYLAQWNTHQPPLTIPSEFRGSYRLLLRKVWVPFLCAEFFLCCGQHRNRSCHRAVLPRQRQMRTFLSNFHPQSCLPNPGLHFGFNLRLRRAVWMVGREGNEHTPVHQLKN